MPTALPTPWPRGPVVVSTPAVWPCSGWPGVLLPHVRSDLRSSSSRPQPPRYSWVYSVIEEWPAESTNRSRPGHCGSAGLCRITFWNSRYAAGARLIAVPGCPVPTFSTASIASTRTVSTARWSSSVHSSLGLVFSVTPAALLSMAATLPPVSVEGNAPARKLVPFQAPAHHRERAYSPRRPAPSTDCQPEHDRPCSLTSAMSHTGHTRAVPGSRPADRRGVRGPSYEAS